MNEEQVLQYWNRLRDGVGLAYNQTSLAVLGLILLALLVGFLFYLPRRHALLPILLMVCFIPMGQRIVIFSLDFTFLRVMVLLAWIRVMVRREYLGYVWKSIDWTLVLWSLCAAGVYITFHRGSLSSIVYKMGSAFDVLGLYFLFRILIRSFEDVSRLVKAFACISLPVTAFFLIESLTGYNPFSLFGGVPEHTRVRGERLRCQGAFAHPIAAGCFWASLIPLFVFMWLQRVNKGRLIFGLGVAACFLIVLFCASSTPVGATMAALVGCCFFPLRRHMRWICLSTGFLLVALHLVMKAPVWQLIARVDLVGGSTAYHRYQLINQAINRVGEWWLMGTASTSHWGHFLFDVANTYVYQAVRGGLITLVLFILVLVAAFKCVSMLWRVIEHDRPKLYLSWALGASLFTHCVSFIALNYSAQTLMILILNLAMIGSLAPIRLKKTVRIWT